MNLIQHLTLLFLFFFAINNTTAQNTKTQNTKKMQTTTIYNYKVKDINGNVFDFSTLKGKKIMVVNTASQCGLTPQYKQLQELYTTYKNKNFIIIAFPANNFGAQEPGTNSQIATFCSINYGVTFPIMEKISVQGQDIHPIYQFLTQKSKNKLADSSVEWNFQKYLIDTNGLLVKIIAPQVLPLDQEIIQWIKSN